MSGTSINDLAGIQPDASAVHEPVESQEAHAPQGGLGLNLGFLKATTGEGELESYTNHPLNFDGKKATSRILRGMTGLFGSLNFAIADIMIGFMEIAKERKIRGE